MKNLFYSLCLLIGFSTTAQASDYQIKESNSNQHMFIKATSYVSSILFKNNIEEIEIDEADEAFDFDINNYLPANFNAFAGLFETANEEEDAPFDFDRLAYLPVGFNATIEFDTAYDIATFEEDEEFDFDTKNYLPVGFNATLDLDAICMATIEEDEPFNFNTNDYLPVGFSPEGSIYNSIVEIAIEEEDEPFEFDAMAYLPEDFQVKESRVAISNIYIMDCITFPSI